MNVLGKQIKERRHLLKIKQQELAGQSADDLPARNMQRARAATGCSIKGFEP